MLLVKNNSRMTLFIKTLGSYVQQRAYLNSAINNRAGNRLSSLKLIINSLYTYSNVLIIMVFILCITKGNKNLYNHILIIK